MEERIRKKEARSPSTFHQFPLLPSEIRLMTWSYYLEDDSHVRCFYTMAVFSSAIFHDTIGDRELPLIFGGRQGKWEPTPVILRVSPESRRFGLEYYSLGFDFSQLVTIAKKHADEEFFNHQRYPEPNDIYRPLDKYDNYKPAPPPPKTYRGIYWRRDRDILVSDKFYDSSKVLGAAEEKFLIDFRWGDPTEGLGTAQLVFRIWKAAWCLQCPRINALSWRQSTFLQRRNIFKTSFGIGSI